MDIIEISKFFVAEENCRAYFESIRWPDAVKCPQCGGAKISKIVVSETSRRRFSREISGEVLVPVSSRILYQCNDSKCRHQFSATSGTMLDRSHLPLLTWFQAIALMLNDSAISATHLARTLDINYRTAWLLYRRIREALTT